MKQKMVYAGLSLLSGLLFASFFSSSTDYIVILCVVIAALILKYPVKMTNTEIFVCAVIFSTGFFMYRADENLIYRKIISYENQQISFVGTVRDITEYSSDKSSYRLKGKINNIQNTEILYYGESADCRIGDKIELVCTLKGFENSFSFNTADYYKSSGIFVQTDDVLSVKLIKSDKLSLLNKILDYRNYICRKIMSYMPYKEGNLFCGMLFGSKIADIDSNTKIALYSLGIGHVFAVSGFHLMVIAGFINFICRKFSVRSSISFGILTAAVAVFTICSGFSVSAVRAGIMIIISYSAGLFSRKGSSINSLCIAIILICLSNPFVVRNPSFLLSVSGFFGIGVFAPYMTADMKEDTALRRIFKGFVSMLCMSVAVIPVSALFFSETSAISAFSNIIFMPVLSAMLLMGIVIFITGGISFIAYPLLKISSFICSFVISVSEITAGMKFSSFPLGYEYVKIIMTASFVIILLTYGIFRKRGYVAISVMLSVLMISGSTLLYTELNKNVVELMVFGKNSSDMLIIRHGNTADIIDISGKRKNVRCASAYMQKYGVKNISTLSVCRNQYRSMAEYNTGLKWYSVENVYFPEKTYILKNSFICGCEPEYFSSERFNLKYSDFSVYADIENSEICVSYGNFFIVFSDCIRVYKNQGEILSSEIYDYISLKTDGISKAEFMR